MPLSRDIGAMLRGEATTAQMFGAAVIGSLLGFVPGFWNGPGLIVLLVALLVIVNVSLPFALLVFGLAKLASLLLLPVSFQVGQWLLDGPTQPLFRWAINAPVLALMGFEHYATTGGLLLGVLFGLAVGWLTARAVGRLRTALAGIDTGSPKYSALADKPWAKVLGWAFLGTKDLHWSQPPSKKRKKLRLVGLIVVLVIGGAAVAAHAALTGPILTGAVRRGLESANGATVELADASLDLAAGRLTLRGLAMADPAKLDTDLFRADLIEAELDTADLLRKRLALDHVSILAAHSGVARATPGVRTAPDGEPPPADTSGGARTIEDYVAAAEQWRERLEQVQRWLESLSGPPEPEAQGPGGWPEELEREAARLGYAAVTAEHLIEGAPSFLVRRLDVSELHAAALPDDVLHVSGTNLSTQPALLAEPATLKVESTSGRLFADVKLGGAGASADKGALKFHLKDWPVDRIAQDLVVGGEPPLAGGTLDASLDGGWAGGAVGQLDLPLHFTLHDTTLRLGGKSQKVKSFAFELGLRGPLDNPSITVDEGGLAKALKAAGAAELAARVDEVKAKAKAKVEEAKADATKEVQQKVDEALKDKLGGLLGGEKKKEGPKKKKDGG